MRVKAIVILMAVLALAACGARRAPPPVAPESVQITAPRFSDAKPHDWAGRRPESYAVHGIDASRWQGDVNWAEARANGVNFAFFKATEGGDRVDPAFNALWDGAGRAGIKRGAYHFFYLCGPADAQARWFIKNVPRTKGSLPPVLDMEWTPFSPTCRSRPDAGFIRSEAVTFSAIIERHYGQRPIIYTSPDFYNDNELWKLSGHEFWLRSVAGHPSERYPGRRWTFWQYSGTGLVPGIAGRVDVNTFAGSENAWRGWLASRQQ